MKYFALLALFFLGPSLAAQEVPKAPEIPFRVVDDYLKIPSDMIMAEAVGVAINSKGHIFILNRGLARSAKALRYSACPTAYDSILRTTCGSSIRPTIWL
jgi:hypothetical protein